MIDRARRHDLATRLAHLRQDISNFASNCQPGVSALIYDATRYIDDTLLYLGNEDKTRSVEEERAWLDAAERHLTMAAESFQRVVATIADFGGPEQAAVKTFG